MEQLTALTEPNKTKEERQRHIIKKMCILWPLSLLYIIKTYGEQDCWCIAPKNAYSMLYLLVLARGGKRHHNTRLRESFSSNVCG